MQHTGEGGVEKNDFDEPDSGSGETQKTDRL